MTPTPLLLQDHAPLAPVSGCPEIVAHQAPDVFALWQAWERACDAVCDVPYWGIVWPAAQVLSQYLYQNPSLVAGKRVLDCGCGSGVVAIAAHKCHAAQITGCDMDANALAVAARNASANKASINLTCHDVTDYCDPNLFDVILVADLFYQKEFSLRLLESLRHAHAKGSSIIIADSGRPFLPKEELEEIHSQTSATSFDVEGCLSRTVRLFRFCT